MKALREALEYHGLATAVRLVACLPRRALPPLAWLLGGLVYHCDRRNIAVARANLDCVFGDTKTPAEKTKIARNAYRTFARTMLELFWAPNLDEKLLRKLVIMEGLDKHPCHRDPGQPVIYFCFHYSNFEWLSLMGPWFVGPAFVVTQKFKNPRLGAIFDRLRSCTGHEVITQEGAFIRMFKHLKKGGKFFMLTDLNLDPREASVPVNCFGLKACMTQLHAALALRCGAEVVPVECCPRPGGGYRVKVHSPVPQTPDMTAQDLAQACWDVLEPSILGHPELWVWAYKHWRFKPSGPEGAAYPFYANTALRFDKLLSSNQSTAVTTSSKTPSASATAEGSAAVDSP